MNPRSYPITIPICDLSYKLRVSLAKKMDKLHEVIIFHNKTISLPYEVFDGMQLVKTVTKNA